MKNKKESVKPYKWKSSDEKHSLSYSRVLIAEEGTMNWETDSRNDLECSTGNKEIENI